MTDRKVVSEHAQVLISKTDPERRINVESTQVLITPTGVTARVNSVHVQVLRPIVATGSVNSMHVQILTIRCRPFRTVEGVHLQRKRDGAFEYMYHLPGH
jgi:hypothetical protein